MGREFPLTFYLDCLFDGILEVGCLVFDLLADLELFENASLDGYLCNTLLVGFCSQFLAVELEGDSLAFDGLFAFFQGGTQYQFLG